MIRAIPVKATSIRLQSSSLIISRWWELDHLHTPSSNSNVVLPLCPNKATTATIRIQKHQKIEVNTQIDKRLAHRSWKTSRVSGSGTLMITWEYSVNWPVNPIFQHLTLWSRPVEKTQVPSVQIPSGKHAYACITPTKQAERMGIYELHWFKLWQTFNCCTMSWWCLMLI